MCPGPGSTRQVAEWTTAQLLAAWLPFVAWTALVWWLGSGDFGAPTTSRILMPFLKWLLPEVSFADRLEIVMAIRKLAHPTIYGVLAALTFRALRLSGTPRPLRAAALALGLSLSVAALDESRQARLPSRTGSVSDLALDGSGAAAALAALLLAVRRRAPPPLEGA